MACPVCKRSVCDHTPTERGQTFEEMMADYYEVTVDEYNQGLRKKAEAPSSK